MKKNVMIKDVIKTIGKVHSYRITSDYWGRVGKLCNRYGEDIVIKATKDLKSEEIPLTDLLNRVEKRCQCILETGCVDEISDIFFQI